MIISEKQIMLLITIAIEYAAFLALIDGRQRRQADILDFIFEIQNQQSQELKVIE